MDLYTAKPGTNSNDEMEEAIQSFDNSDTLGFYVSCA